MAQSSLSKFKASDSRNWSEEERQEWVRQMRLKFSPKDMIKEDGAINEDYFKPKKDKIMMRKWGELERDYLARGIEKYGIGEWDKIVKEFLPQWAPTELRAKTQRLLGRQSLVEYIAEKWKGTKADIEMEFERNKEIGTMLSHWKGGMLINDDHGRVKQLLQTHPYPASTGKKLVPKPSGPTEEDKERARSLVGKRVQVWFEDVGLYFGGEVVSYIEPNDIHLVTWDTADNQTTRVELREKDHTTDKSNDSRWCLESELAEFENNANNANNNDNNEDDGDNMEVNNDSEVKEENDKKSDTNVVPDADVIEFEDESLKPVDSDTIVNREPIAIQDNSSVNLNSDMSIGEAMALVEDFQQKTQNNANNTFDNNNDTDDFV